MDLNRYIDQTILRPESTEAMVREFLAGVIKHRFIAACLNPCWVDLARSVLPPEIKVCSVVGFPLGAETTPAKVRAAEDLVKRRCDEIDMVCNIGRLKGGDHKYVGREIREVVKAAQGRVVKVIIETCLLNEEEKKSAARIVKESGAAFVKTSTGFSREGARIEDVALLRKIVGPQFGVKASGGIRDLAAVMAMINAGASRIGTSAGESIMEEYHKQAPIAK